LVPVERTLTPLPIAYDQARTTVSEMADYGHFFAADMALPITHSFGRMAAGDHKTWCQETTPCPEKKRPKCFVISSIKLIKFVTQFLLNIFATKSYKGFPSHLNNVSKLPCNKTKIPSKVVTGIVIKRYLFGLDVVWVQLHKFRFRRVKRLGAIQVDICWRASWRQVTVNSSTA